jgi:hypothetical protein
MGASVNWSGHPFALSRRLKSIQLAGEPIRRMSTGLRAFSSVRSRFARANPRMVDAKRGPSWRPSISRGAEELRLESMFPADDKTEAEHRQSVLENSGLRSSRH